MHCQYLQDKYTERLKRESDVMSLNSEGNEFQSLAAAYLSVDCPR